MQNELLRQIRLKISSGTASREEVETWSRWIRLRLGDHEQFVSDEDVELYLRLKEEQPDWASFLTEQQHKFLYHAEAGITQPNRSEISGKLAPVITMNYTYRKIRVFLAAVIIGALVLHAGWHSMNRNPITIKPDHPGPRQFVSIQNPAGSSPLPLTLPDSTKVLLNANTSIRYPLLFATDKRQVEINGEAYLEVSKNEQQPFIVSTNKSEIKVLGTRFNLDAYSDLETETTSLLEGTIMVVKKNSSESKILKPGEQSILTEDKLNVQSIVHAESFQAWRKDSFAFHLTPLKEIMKRISKYYGVKVKYGKGVENRRYTIVATTRKLSLFQLLKGMESTGRLKFHPRKETIYPGETITILTNL